MTPAKKQQLNTKALKIMDFCNMLNNSTPSAVEYFKRERKTSKKHQKPIIKKRIYEKHFFKDTVYVNPNIQAMMERVNRINKNAARKIREFVDSLTM